MQLQFLAPDDQMSTFMQSQGRAPAKFVELDFPEVTKKKAACIANTPELWQLLGQERPSLASGNNNVRALQGWQTKS